MLFRSGVSVVPNKSAVSKPVISSDASTLVKKPANIRPLAFSPAPVTARASETQVKPKPLMIPEFLKRAQRGSEVNYEKDSSDKPQNDMMSVT